jgi:hypothetical protein
VAGATSKYAERHGAWIDGAAGSGDGVGAGVPPVLMARV